MPTRLVWDGAACGERDDFVARVMRRNRAIRFVPSGEEVAVRLSIQAIPGGLDARVRIEAKGRPPVTRRIQSPDCDDALDALALVVAIGVEGHPSGAVRRPRPPKVTPPASTPPPEPAPVPEPPAAQPPSEPEPSPVAAPEPPPPAATQPVNGGELAPSPRPAAEQAAPLVDGGATPEAVASGGLLLAVGLAAQVSVGITPEPLLGGAVWLSAEWDRAGWLAPEIVLDALHQERNGHDDSRGQADFALNALSLALCPLRLGKRTLELRPCLMGALGRLDAEGSQTYSPREQTSRWSSIGIGVSASAVLGIVELRASLAASVPLDRDSFRFGPDCVGSACEADVFHRVTPLIWSGALGAGLTPR